MFRSPPLKPATRRAALRALGACALVAGMPMAARAQAAARPGGYTELRWDDLVPKGWDPTKGMRDRNVAGLPDSDPRAGDLMRELREAWDNAPTLPALDGAAIKLPGYLVPLDETTAGITEFLLVPYFGACIHTPPPPANQIVLVRPARPLTGYRTMDTVWASGRLRTTRSQSQRGASGYTLEAALIDRYVAAPR